MIPDLSRVPHFWSITEAVLAQLICGGILALISGIPAVTRRLVRRRTAKLKPGIDSDRMREELEGLITDMNCAERIDMAIRLLQPNSEINNDLSQGSAIEAHWRNLNRQIDLAMSVVESVELAELTWNHSVQKGTTSASLVFLLRLKLRLAEATLGIVRGNIFRILDRSCELVDLGILPQDHGLPPGLVSRLQEFTSKASSRTVGKSGDVGCEDGHA